MCILSHSFLAHIHDYKFIIIPYILPTTTSSSSSVHSLERRRRRFARSKEIFSVFSSTRLSSSAACVYIYSQVSLPLRVYNLFSLSLFLGQHTTAAALVLSARNNFFSSTIHLFTSYDYKVYDVRKLPNHIALDSTGVRT